MAQDYFSGDMSPAGDNGEGSSRVPEEPSERPPPSYMTVGNGYSENAEALMASLNNDSGYGGSIASGSDFDASAGWRAGLMEDRPTPMHTPTLPGEWNPAGSLTSFSWRDEFDIADTLQPITRSRSSPAMFISCFSTLR
jgi:mitofusin